MTIRIVVAEIESEGSFLLTQRLSSSSLPLLWEFPGGRVQNSETDEEALQRALSFRIGAQVKIQEKLMEHMHSYEGYTVGLSVYRVVLCSQVHVKNVEDVRWVPFEELQNYSFPEADQATMDLLLQETV